jgi:hypothetical protein
MSGHERVTLDEILRERGVSGEVFDLPYLDAVVEWGKRTSGWIPALAPIRDPSGDVQEYIPTREEDA